MKTSKLKKQGAAKTKAVKTKKTVSSKAEAKPLTKKERKILGESEKVIGAGLGQFLKVGQALMKINSSRLYRETFPTFEKYCKVRWSLGPAYAHRLINSAKCVAKLKKAATGVLPSNESQVRSLTKLPAKSQVTAWKHAVKQANGNLTAQVVAKVVNEMLGKPSKKTGRKSTKKRAEHQLKSIGKLVSEELEKSKTLKPKLKKLFEQILKLTGSPEKSNK